ncbi:MAG: diadenylate cyclase [Phycisphaerae bacterium]|nr:diadenylate cyclase [Phycisphaerae bacterium]
MAFTLGGALNLKPMQDITNYLDRIASYDLRILVAEWLLIGLAVWAVLRFLRGTRGARMMKGAALLLVIGYALVNLVAARLGLDRISVLYDKFLIGALFALAIVFQPELRRALMRIGETRLFRSWSSQVSVLVEKVVAAASYLSEHKIGALIAIERESGLTGLGETGVTLDAELTPDLLTTIFWPGSSLHDMGVIIQHGRVTAAGCQFPLAESGELPHELGSRHRAALGLAMESDALIIVVSEETGAISLALRGKLIRPLLPEQLRRRLLLELAPGLAETPADERIVTPEAAGNGDAAEPAAEGDASNDASDDAATH